MSEANAASPSEQSERVDRLVMRGYDRLWAWFGLSRSTWLTLPRVMMHDMPDEWQNRMAELLEEWDETWDSHHMPEPHVTAKQDNKFAKWPSWLLNYRHPDKGALSELRRDA